MGKGERKSGSRKRSKLAEVIFDSDDDEPIGSLLKVKKSEKGKKGKRGKEEDVGEEDEGLDEMGDTLASFRKKLRAPKRGVGSGVVKGRGSVVSVVVEPSGVSSSGGGDGVGAAADDVSETLGSGCDRVGLMSDKKVKTKSRRNPKRLKVDIEVKNLAVNDDNEEYAEDAVAENEKDVGLRVDKASDRSCGGDVDDSLSAYFQKQQSTSVRKSCISSGLVHKIGSEGKSDSVLKKHKSVTVGAHKLTQTSILTSEYEKFEGNKQLASGHSALDSAPDERNTDENQWSMNRREACQDGMDGASSFPTDTDDCSLKNMLKEQASTVVPLEEIQREKLCGYHESDVQKASSLNATHKVQLTKDVLDHDYGEMLNANCMPNTTENNYGGDKDDNNKSTHEIIPKSIIQYVDFPENKILSQQYPSGYYLDTSRVEDFSNDYSNPVKHANEPSPLSVSSQNEDAEIINYRFDSSKDDLSHKNQVSENRFLSNQLSFGDGANDTVAPIQKCSLHSDRSQLLPYKTEGTSIPCPDDHPCDEEASRASTCATLDENESIPEDVVSLPDYEDKDYKPSTIQHPTRKTKNLRHEDMAYEGDADWEVLVNDHQLLGGRQTAVGDQSLRARDGQNPSSEIFFKETVDDGVVAVSAGLKARTVGPVEKIKFKELLKRKGGLEEYLECRNYILHLWNKDLSRILLPSDCGITGGPANDEPLRTSLLRKIYTFLDQSGYINFGIASRKEKVEPVAKHSYKIVKEKSIEEKAESSFPYPEDGVSFILGQVTQDRDIEEATKLKNDAIIEEENFAIESKETKEMVSEVKSQSLNATAKNNIASDEFIVGSLVDPKIPKELVDINVLDIDPSSESKEGITCPVKLAAATNDLQLDGCQSVPDVCMRDNYQAFRSTEAEKSVIVIGAGPAGLIAARHLQRQGIHVTVLEARNRIGGRVYTDRSSLSVPVDLGASIITGIEADVATERRPDPSSLICSQLGLELTVLNSDCPLFDIVTGQKVPADLDDTLEAEYNSLLDDMVLLVAQKGEHAMKMSLEDGLEYALKKRRMASSSSKIEDSELGRPADASVDSRRNTGSGMGSGKFCPSEDILNPLERRIMNWHFAHLEYGCAALLKDVSLPYWNQDDAYGGFGGAHCMIKGGYSAVVESLSEGIGIYLNHVVTDISYGTKDSSVDCGHHKVVKVSTSNGKEFVGDAALITVPLGCLKAGTIKFTPSLPPWKYTSIQRLGFGVLNKVILEFPEVFWDDSVDYFGATAEEINERGRCFMFWNVKKTVGAPVLIALLAGKAAIDGQSLSSSDHVNHALMVLRKLFGEASVPDPVASVVTDWGGDPFSYGAYSYVAIGASGEDYDMLGRPVDSCLFFAGEATCKEHPDTVGGAMISGLREAVRIIDLLCTGNDFTAEGEAMEAAQRQTGYERDEVRDITTRLEAVEISNSLYKNSLDGTKIISREALLREMFFGAKTMAGRLFVAKELLKFPVGKLKSFAGTKKGLTTINSWILDSLGKDGTQLLRHCVRMLVLVSTDLVAVRSSGIGRTVKDKVCVHTSRDIRYIASQLVNVWLEIFRKGRDNLKLSRRMNYVDTSRKKLLKDSNLGKPPVGTRHCHLESKIGLQVAASSASPLLSGTDNITPVEYKPAIDSSNSGGTFGRRDKVVDKDNYVMSEEEKASLAATEKARAAALAAAEAYKSYEAKYNMTLQLPKIPSFHKFARGEHNPLASGSDSIRKFSDGILGRPDHTSEIDSRNCRVRDWSIDFSAAAAGVNLDCSRMSGDNLSRRSHSIENACPLSFKENSGESAAVDSSIFAKAWVDIDGSVGIKDSLAIERWQSQAAAAGAEFFYPDMHIKDEEDSITNFKPPTWRHHGLANESSVSQDSINMESSKTLPRGAAHIKQAVVDFAASLLMPLYKEKKIDRDGYKSIMKKTATKVMEKATDAEKTMTVNEFLDFKRRNKIRDFVDKLIERHMGPKPAS